jgi:hypothetical protein
VSLATARTDSLQSSGSEELAALTGGYHAGLLVGAVFAATAAACAALLLRFGPARVPQAEARVGSA